MSMTNSAHVLGEEMSENCNAAQRTRSRTPSSEKPCDTSSEDGKTTSASGEPPAEDLCDTCSGDSDDGWDTISLCSWTTDQGEWELPKSSGSATPESAANGSASMCYGYAPNLVPMVAVPCVYVMAMGDASFESSAIGSPFPESNPSQMSQWPAQTDTRWSQPLPPPPGVWTRPSPSSWRSCGSRGARYRTDGRSKAKSRCSKQSSSTEATTIILRNMPIECTRDVLLQILKAEGFGKAFDFLHVPVDFQTWQCLGYAILNLASHELALRVQEHFTSFTRWPFPSDKVCEVAWNCPHQGLATHIDRYRNSPLMHFSVSDEYRPVLFKAGVRKAFPAPTTRTRAPRIRHQKPETIMEDES